MIFDIIIITRPWPAFGWQGLVGSSFEYSYTRLASRLRRSARSWIMTWGNDKTNYFNLPTFQPFDLPTFQPSNLPTFRPSNLPIFQPSSFLIFQPFPKVSRNRRNDKIPWIRKVSGNRRNNKIPWKNHYFQGFCFTVSRHFWIWKVSGYRRKDQIPWIPNVSINRKSDQILWIRNVSRNMETTKFFEYGIIIECVKKHGNDQISWIRKVSRNMETTKFFEYGIMTFVTDTQTDSSYYI